MNIGVRIDPDHMHVPELLERGEHGGTGYRVITTERQGLNEVTTLAVEFLVAVLGLKLDVLHYEWLLLANIFKAVVVNVLSATVDARSALTLVAVGEDGLKLVQRKHWVLSFEVSHLFFIFLLLNF